MLFLFMTCLCTDQAGNVCVGGVIIYKLLCDGMYAVCREIFRSQTGCGEEVLSGRS